MTRERKMAIRQWTDIVNRRDMNEAFDLYNVKRSYSKNFNWDKDCWFCQYARGRNYDIENPRCNKCPLFKYEVKYGALKDCEDIDKMCGRENNLKGNTPYNSLFNLVNHHRDVVAARKILALLEGKSLEEVNEIE